MYLTFWPYLLKRVFLLLLLPSPSSFSSFPGKCHKNKIFKWSSVQLLSHLFCSALRSELPNIKPQVTSTEVGLGLLLPIVESLVTVGFKHLSQATFPLQGLKRLLGVQGRLNPSLWGQPVPRGHPSFPVLEMVFYLEEFLAWTDKQKYVVSECFPGYSVSLKAFFWRGKC